MSSATDRRYGLIGNTAIKVPCRACATANITLLAEQTIDGVALVTGDRVLLTAQTSSVDNGIYVVDTGAWIRASDMDGSYDAVQGTLVNVNGGTANLGFWYVTTTGTIVFGTSSITFGRASSTLAVVSAFMQTVLAQTTAALARTALGALAKAGDTLTGLLNLAAGADITSAATVDLTAATGNCPRITGTVATSAFTMNAGQQMMLIANAAWPLIYNATTNKINGGVNYNCAAGDRVQVFKDLSGIIQTTVFKSDGTAVVVAATVVTQQIQPISASVGSSALTISASALSLDFRSATLTSGTVANISGTPANLVVPSTATLGTVNATQSRLAVLAMNNAGTIELAVVNLSGGNDLSETGVISTTAIAAGSNTANVIYSTTSRANLAYRVIGYIESTQATAGTWATAPSTIQGEGGNAVSAMSSFGYGQTWQDVSGSRAVGNTYYNTTGKPIMVSIYITGAAGALSVGGVAVTVAGASLPHITVVPPGKSYSMSTGTIVIWAELR